MTQLYREEIMEPQHIFLVSPRTKARFLGFFPMTFQVTWDMKVEPVDENRSRFTCTVGAGLNPFYFIAGLFIRLSYWTEAHTEEETPHFAESAARWATRNDLERRDSYIGVQGQFPTMSPSAVIPTLEQESSPRNPRPELADSYAQAPNQID